jgi:carbonic anhydrase/acetyltransferase-like protein (isoleucine patch superfamily)
MTAIVRPYRGLAPRLAASVDLAPTASVIGDVEIGEDSSIWYGAVLRGDVGQIRIGKRTNVQDLSCLHMSLDQSHAVLGDDVTVGHNAVIHGAIVEAGALIGIGAILLDNARRTGAVSPGVGPTACTAIAGTTRRRRSH